MLSAWEGRILKSKRIAVSKGFYSLFISTNSAKGCSPDQNRDKLVLHSKLARYLSGNCGKRGGSWLLLIAGYATHAYNTACVPEGILIVRVTGLRKTAGINRKIKTLHRGAQ